ncbi:MAG: hypothetical protein CR967_04975 [Proteobacteria bacterium]|nr:MAG: hypothetical protein CR967_04975 [Pseudomonadota bacterium]
MQFIQFIEYIGIMAFALSGFYIATKHRLDLLGIFISALLTALGGGITRDALANKAPYTFTHLTPGLLVVGVLAFAIFFKLHKNFEVQRNFVFILSDTLGLASFAITSAILGLEVGFGYFGVVLLAFITAVGGGVFRDILLNQIPLLLSTGLYGTIALVVGTLVFLVDLIDFLNPYSIMLIFIFGVIFRLLAYYRGWNLPILK